MSERMRKLPSNEDTAVNAGPTMTKRTGPSSTNTATHSTHPPLPSPSAAIGFGADWTFEGILAKGYPFKSVPRVSALEKERMLQAIEAHEKSGIPLIIDHWHEHPGWGSDLLDIEWLLRNKGEEVWQVCDMQDRRDVDMTLSKFVARSRAGEKDGRTDIFYGKDAECPEEWSDWIKSGVLPDSLSPHGSNDLFKNLATETSVGVQTLMCYLGGQGTFTACHKDLCASFGHNIMTWAEAGGSAFWFMTASADAAAMCKYYQEQFGLELDWETHVTDVDQFTKATFPIYVAEQKLGDLVLVPPRGCHQVVNRGGLTMKVSWSRMTTQGLEAALWHELPIYRRVCRKELYRIKHIVYRSLLSLTDDMKAMIQKHTRVTYSKRPLPKKEASDEVERLSKTLSQLLVLFDFVIREDYSPKHAKLPTIFREAGDNESAAPETSTSMRRSAWPRRFNSADELAPSAPPSDDSCNLACDFCGADVFQSFFECHRCVPGGDPRDFSEDEDSDNNMGRSPRNKQALGDGLLLCPGCYAEGRTCKCGVMHAAQCRSFSSLLKSRNDAAVVLTAASALFAPDESRPPHKELTESDIARSQDPQMFHAGCQLLEMRRADGSKANQMQKCGRCTSGPGHDIPRSHSLYCKPCHKRICFLKLVQLGMHSTDALLLLHGDASVMTLHKRHLEAQKTYNEGMANVKKAEKSGASSDYHNLLVAAANKYATCWPVQADRVRLGFYDLESQVSAEGNRPARQQRSNAPEDGQHVGRSTQHRDLDDLYMPVSSFSGSPTPSGHGESSSGATSQRSSSSSKRHKMEVYIDVPEPARKRSFDSSTIQTSKVGPPLKRPREDSVVRTPNDSIDEERLTSDYGMDLAAAMNAAISSPNRPRVKPQKPARVASSTKTARKPLFSDSSNDKSEDEDDQPLYKTLSRPSGPTPSIHPPARQVASRDVIKKRSPSPARIAPTPTHVRAEPEQVKASLDESSAAGTPATTAVDDPPRPAHELQPPRHPSPPSEFAELAATLFPPDPTPPPADTPVELDAPGVGTTDVLMADAPESTVDDRQEVAAKLSGGLTPLQLPPPHVPPATRTQAPLERVRIAAQTAVSVTSPTVTATIQARPPGDAEWTQMREMLTKLNEKVEQLTQENVKRDSDYASLLEKHLSLERSYKNLQDKHDLLDNNCQVLSKSHHAFKQNTGVEMHNVKGKLEYLKTKVDNFHEARQLFETMQRIFGPSQDRTAAPANLPPTTDYPTPNPVSGPLQQVPIAPRGSAPFPAQPLPPSNSAPYPQNNGPQHPGASASLQPNQTWQQRNQQQNGQSPNSFLRSSSMPDGGNQRNIPPTRPAQSGANFGAPNAYAQGPPGPRGDRYAPESYQHNRPVRGAYGGPPQNRTRGLQGHHRGGRSGSPRRNPHEPWPTNMPPSYPPTSPGPYLNTNAPVPPWDALRTGMTTTGGNSVPSGTQAPPGPPPSWQGPPSRPLPEVHTSHHQHRDDSRTVGNSPPSPSLSHGRHRSPSICDSEPEREQRGRSSLRSGPGPAVTSQVFGMPALEPDLEQLPAVDPTKDDTPTGLASVDEETQPSLQNHLTYPAAYPGEELQSSQSAPAFAGTLGVVDYTSEGGSDIPPGLFK